MRNILHAGILISLLLASPMLSALTIEVNSITDGARLGSAPTGVCDTGAVVAGPDGQAVAACGLRAAIQTANDHGGPALIRFADYILQNSTNPPASMFQPQTALPSITVQVEIDGRTHPAFDTSLRRPAVIIRGDDLNNSESGLVISGSAASGSIIQAVAVYYFPLVGIMISNSNNNRISGSHVGINALGTSARPNGYGVFINGGDNNIIGNLPSFFTIPAPKPNLISGNTNDGVIVNIGNDNWIANNHIGLNLSGTNVVPNGRHGVYVNVLTSGTQVGGHQTVSGLTYKRYNVLAGNLGGQIEIMSNTPSSVGCNRIGTRPDLSATLPAPVFGIRLRDNQHLVGTEVCENVIATTTDTAIAVGIMSPELEVTSSDNLILNNYIGMSPAGAPLAGSGEFGVHVANGNNNAIFDNRIGNVHTAVRIGFSFLNYAFGNFIGVDHLLNAHPVNTGFFSEGQFPTYIGVSFDGGENVIGHAVTGINLSAADDNYLASNWLGVAPDGTAIMRDGALTGIRVSGKRNDIGTIGYGNFVGPFPTGILVSPGPNDDNHIAGNSIGVTHDGFALGGGDIGIHVRAPGNVIDGNRVGLFTDGILLDFGSDGSQVIGNEIGAGFDGLGFGNVNNGLIVLSDGNNIGGGTSESFNLIGDNQDGMAIVGDLNTVRGAFIGLTPDNSLVGNSRHGIHILPTANNTYIGHQSFSGLSYIGANGGHGIYSQGMGTVLDLLFIGTTPNGSPAGNGGDGLHLATLEEDLGLHTFVYRNHIEHNQGWGANVQNSVRGGHFIRESRIFGNQSGGIHLGPGGRDQDPGDADTGPNHLQNFPDFDPLASGANHVNNQLQVRLRVDSAPGNSRYPLDLEFFTASTDASPQGLIPVGVLSYEEADAGQWVTASVDPYPGIELAPGQLFVATASAMGDQSFATSEFSEPFGSQYDPDRIFSDRLEAKLINFSTHLAASFRHPRCTTCHAVAATNFANVNDDPPGVLPASHPEVSAATDCTSCHSGSLLPPTGSIDPGWQSAPVQFDFRDKSDSQLCSMASQPVSGHSPLDHMTEDRLVLWAVGDGRVPFGGTLPTAPPHDIEQWRSLIQQWVAAGMPCE